MKSYTRIFASLALLGCGAPAFAQVYQYPPTRPLQWFIDGGATVTQGRTADFLGSGWTIGTGFTLRPAPGPFMLRVDLNYSRFGATNQLISLGQAVNGTQVDNGYGQTVTGFLSGVLQAPVNPWMRFYATGGVGLGYRRIELTQNAFLCDAFFCGSDFGSSTLVASQATTRFAWNAGLGVDFALPGGQSWFVEARYERIETVEPTEFIPIRFGLRF
ncbi:MAG TPA: outer membrane beta-barrel protein [Steroidobacteraceae bacterium]